jgi:hypothetical protein
MLFAVIASAFVALGWSQMEPTRACDDTGMGVSKEQGDGTNYWMWYARTGESNDPRTFVWSTFQPNACQPVDILGGTYQMMECVDIEDGQQAAHVTFYGDNKCSSMLYDYTYNETMIPTGMQGTHVPMDYWCNGTDQYATIRIAIDSECKVGADFNVATGPCLYVADSTIMDNACTRDAFYWQFYTPGASPLDWCADAELCTRYTVTGDCDIMIGANDAGNPAHVDVYAQMLMCDGMTPSKNTEAPSDNGSITASLSLVAALVLAFIHN